MSLSGLTEHGVGISKDPHLHAPLLATGPSLGEADSVVVLLHGRGASARDILPLGPGLAPGATCLALQATASTWYPDRFIAPLEANEPWLSSALARIDRLLEEVSAAGISAERTILAGFSQGACLALHYAATRPRQYAGVAAFTGGLIGPPGRRWEEEGSLAETPIYLTSGVPDPHVPVWRLEESAEHLEKLGGQVTLRLMPGQGHWVDPARVTEARKLLEANGSE